jgi:hypothetical protein
MIKELTLSVVGGLLLLGSAQATQIASFTEVNGTNDFTLSNNGTSNSFTASSLINVTLYNASYIANGTTYQAILTVTGDSSTASGTLGGGTVTQNQFQNGVLSIMLTSGPFAGEYLLAAAFGNSAALNSAISGQSNGSSATFSSSDNPGNYSEVVFVSGFWNILGPSQNGISAFSFSLSNLSTQLSLDNGTPDLLNAFKAAGSGTFSASLAGTQVPEPGTLGLLGAAMVGLGLLGRKRVRR